MSVTSATAFAPASVGNVGIGFDILGHTFPALGDRVRARRSATAGVRITSIGGVVRDLPLEVAQNTAGMSVQALLEVVQPGFGVELDIEKGIPLGSGLGGSAASAVAGVVAANALLPEPRPALELLRYAMRGEAVASGAVHVDNIAPSLFGGLVLTVGIDNPRIKQIPVPPMIRCVLVHPRMFLGTREARGILNRSVDLADVVWQTANLAGFLAGCYTSDLAMIRDAFEDVMIEPQRARLIPGFAEVKRAAMDRGALGCSISGAGPSVFAWCEEAQAGAIAAAMAQAFAGEGLESDQWVAAIEAVGARVEERS